MDRLKWMKETLMTAVEEQMMDLSKVNTAELGEAIDMIKDLAETMYYCTITKAMKEADEERVEMYHMPKGTMWQGGAKSITVNNTNELEIDEKAGRAWENRRAYMAAREVSDNKTVHMKELEAYAHQLTNDILEMMQEASIEEKQMLKKKMIELSGKM